MSKDTLPAMRNSNRTENFLLHNIYALYMIINRTVDMYCLGLILLIYPVDLNKTF
jgi:hypothetical protein